MEKSVSDVTAEVNVKAPPPPPAAAKVKASPAPPPGSDDTPKEPTLDELRARAKELAPNVKLERVEPTPESEKDGKKVPAEVGHVAASFGNRRVSHAVHDGCSAEDAEAAVLRSVIAHHGG